ncbi:chymotrypsin inhibitor-like [Augochlora pura]
MLRFRFVFALLVVLAMISTSVTDPGCGMNSYLSPCGAPCEPSCDDLLAVKCVSQDIVFGFCIPSCVCIRGYVRNSTGFCIPLHAC